MRGHLAAACALVTASCGYPEFAFEAPSDDAANDSTIADGGTDTAADVKADAHADVDADADARTDAPAESAADSIAESAADSAPETLADSLADSGADSVVDTRVDSVTLDTRSDALADSSDPCALVDDLEDGDGQVILTCGRDGWWFSFNDGTTTGVQTPDPSLTYTPSAGGPGTSLFAAYTTGTGFTSWGAGMGFNFVDHGVSFDASAYGGIRFWARIDTGSTATSLRFDFPDVDTDPRGGVCTTKTAGCYDHFGIDLTLGTTWTLTTIRFADLGQLGFGYAAPSFDKSKIYTMQLQTGASKTFGVWLDDITLVP